jgi:RimJ/RimL family protein N-acetyltransferase
MIVRRALAEDSRAIAEVHVSAWQHAYRGMVPQAHLDRLSIADREKNWIRIFEQGEPEALVADTDGQIIGFISFGRSRSDPAVREEAEVYALYVAPAHWWTGVGWSLWQAALVRLRELGFTRVIVWVLAANERAIRFYERIGCSRSEGFETSVAIGGEKLPECRYEIAIATTRPGRDTASLQRREHVVAWSARAASQRLAQDR